MNHKTEFLVTAQSPVSSISPLNALLSAAAVSLSCCWSFILIPKDKVRRAAVPPCFPVTALARAETKVALLIWNTNVLWAHAAKSGRQ